MSTSVRGQSRDCHARVSCAGGCLDLPPGDHQLESGSIRDTMSLLHLRVLTRHARACGGVCAFGQRLWVAYFWVLV